MIASLVMLAMSPAPQTQAQQDRIDAVARYSAVADACPLLGFTADPSMDDQVDARLRVEAAGWPLAPAKIDELASRSLDREKTLFEGDLAAVKMTTDAQLRRTREVYVKLGRTCLAASADPIFRGLLIAPEGFDGEAAATTISDKALARGGLASWQTPVIRARGDLMMLAGMCRSKIGAARSDELRRTYGASEDPRPREYYAHAFDDGLSDQGGTLPGCNRAILSTIREAKPK